MSVVMTSAPECRSLTASRSCELRRYARLAHFQAYGFAAVGEGRIGTASGRGRTGCRPPISTLIGVMGLNRWCAGAVRCRRIDRPRWNVRGGILRRATNGGLDVKAMPLAVLPARNPATAGRRCPDRGRMHERHTCPERRHAVSDDWGRGDRAAARRCDTGRPSGGRWRRCACAQLGHGGTDSRIQTPSTARIGTWTRTG